MAIKAIIIGTIIAVILLGSSQLAAATSLATPSYRLAINPDFDPDESCLFDVYQDKCYPGFEGKCPKPQFGGNEDGYCFPKTFVDGEWKWMCPEGYHNTDNDESGQCYPNDEGCDAYIIINGTRMDYTLLTDRPDGKSDRCADPRYLCNDDPTQEVCDLLAKARAGGQLTEEIIYDKNADLPICVYKVIVDCKTRSGLICAVDTTIDPCKDIFHGFTGTDENYKPDTDQFIVPEQTLNTQHSVGIINP